MSELIEIYRKTTDSESDNDGKKLFGILDTELRERRVDRSELVKMVVDYLFEIQDGSLGKLTQFLKTQMES